MITKYFIKYFYIGLTILVFITPINISIYNFLPGLILTWLIYFTFIKGAGKFSPSPRRGIIDMGVGKSYFPFYIAIIYVIFYPLYIKYYTGLEISVALRNLMSGVSNYQAYQLHFSDAELSKFNWTKFPYIIVHAVLQLTFISIVFKILLFQSKSNLLEKTSIAIMVLIIILVGLARGTSFELFELFLIFFFAYLTRRIFNGQKILNKKIIIYTLGLIFVFTIYYIYNIGVRMGDNFSFSHESDLDTNSILYSLNKPLAVSIYSLYGYFLFGLHYISIVISQLWFGSIDGFFSIFIPTGISIFNIEPNYRDFVENFIQLGTKWNPDISVYIDSYGIILTFIFIFIIGKYSTKIANKMHENIPACILSFYICFGMISLPVGNFITVSSANYISIILALLLYNFGFLKQYFFNYLILKNVQKNISH